MRALSSTTEPSWVLTARKYIGTKEIPGPRHNATILRWWSLTRAPFTDDETPWCAGFVGGVLEECGIRSTRSAAARSYENWGVRLTGPLVGAIAIKKRYSKGRLVGGHVGFVIGRDRFGNLLILGGNQNDEVNIAAYNPADFHDFRWPSSAPLPANRSLPIIANISTFKPREA